MKKKNWGKLRYYYQHRFFFFADVKHRKEEKKKKKKWKLKIKIQKTDLFFGVTVATVVVRLQKYCKKQKKKKGEE